MSSHRCPLGWICLRLTRGALLAMALFGGVAIAAKPATHPRAPARSESEGPDTPREAAPSRYAQRAYPLTDVPQGAYLAAHRSWRALIERATSPLFALSSAEGNAAQLG